MFVDRVNGQIVAAFNAQQRPGQEEVSDAEATAGLAAARAAKLAAKPLGEQLDATEFPGRLLAAVVIRMSSQWASLSPTRKQSVQDIVDAGASTIIGVLP